MDSKDELFKKVADTVGLETLEENTATAIRDKMQEEISFAIGGAYDKGLAEGKKRTIDYTLTILHVFADNLENKHDAEIVTQCIKLVEMMKE